MDSLTLVTFLVFHPLARSVELLGSWDNFTTPYVLEKDPRKGHGNWTGCFMFKDIIFDGDLTQVTPKRDGGLKMGGTYWYYYRLDQDIEFFDPTKPTTTACPLLPGQRLNVLEVPIACAMFGHSNDVTGDLAVELPITLNPSNRFTALQPPRNRKRVSSSDPRTDPHRVCGDMTRGSSLSSPDSARNEDIYEAAFSNNLHRQGYCFSPADHTRNKDKLPRRSLAAPMKWALQHLRHHDSPTTSKEDGPGRNGFRTTKQSASRKIQPSVQKIIDISSPALTSGTNLLSHTTLPTRERAVPLAPPGSPVQVSNDLQFQDSESYLDHDMMVSTVLPRIAGSRPTTSGSRTLDDKLLEASPLRRHPADPDGRSNNIKGSTAIDQTYSKTISSKQVVHDTRSQGNLPERAVSSGENRSRPSVGTHRYISSEEVRSHLPWISGDRLAASTSDEDEVISGHLSSLPSARAPRNGFVAINNYMDVAIRDSQLGLHMDDSVYDLDQRELIDPHTRKEARGPAINLAQMQPEMSRELRETSHDFTTSHDLWASRNYLQAERPTLLRSQFSQWTYTSEESSPSSPNQAADEDQSPTFSSIEEIASDIESSYRQTRTSTRSSSQLFGDGAQEHVGDLHISAHHPVVGGSNDGALVEGTDFRRQAGLFDLPQGFYDSDPPEKMDLVDPNVEENLFDAAFSRSISSRGLEGASSGDKATLETTTAHLRGSITESMLAVSPHMSESLTVRTPDYCHHEKTTPVEELVNEFGYLGEVVF